MKRPALLLLALLAGTAVSVAQMPATELIVTLKGGMSIDAINAEHGTTTVRQIESASVYLISQSDHSPGSLKKLERDTAVESVEVNGRIELDDSAETLFLLDDNAETLFLLDTRKRSILNGVDVPSVYAEQPALSVIGADLAREISTGAATRVAYIDTGVDLDHPALRPWLDPGIDLVYGRSASEFDSLNLADSAETLFLLDEGASEGLPRAFGHGTLVAGIIHAVAPDAAIVPIKAFDADGRTTMFTVLQGVYSALDLNIDVLNMSFSTGMDSPAFRKAIDQVRAQGISVVSSVGNGGRDARAVFPASYTGVFGVAATDFEDRLAPFSNYGKSVAVTAPGAFIVSTAPGGGYAVAWGTSFSAPFVGGTLALLHSLQQRGSAHGPTVLSTADSIDQKNPGLEKQLGKGRVNAAKALERRQ